MLGRHAPVIAALGLFWSSATSAAISVTPVTPTTGDRITIRVSNSFGAQARATSANITQTANTFTIQQNVEIACLLPNPLVVTSQFEVGPLPTGTYDVLADITFTSVDPLPCFPAPVTQTSSFTVAAPIPALNTPVLIGLGTVLAAVALAALKR